MANESEYSSVILSAWQRDPSVQALLTKNPLYGNPLQTRQHLRQAVLGFYDPLRPWYSTAGARLRLGVGGVHYGSAAAEMESFVRPLWGLAPLLAGGGEFDDLPRYLSGLTAGMDPDHPEYWGDVGPYDQRMVEMAGLSLAFLLAPEQFWQPLSAAAKDHIARWLLTINDFPTADNNWLFFRVLANLALRNVGRSWSDEAVRAALQRIDSFYLGDGWYRDGERYQLDYYVPMALHFYGLMVAQLAGDLYPDHAARYRQRARVFAADFQHWFADDGAAVPFGRSMTYRFAQGAFWAACAFAGEEVLPWGRIKGLLLRHLRWWGQQPICERDGVLSIGYGYPNLLMSEAYNAPGSPYWALKSFLVLALPEQHPFWQAEEESPQALDRERVVMPASGFIGRRGPADAVLLTGGQDGCEHRGCDAKYARFAYSSAHGFSLSSDANGPERPDYSALDSGLMVSRDGLSFLSRSRISEAGIDQNMAFGRWQPDAGLEICSWVDFASPGWHIRIHRIITSSELQVVETGFAVDRSGDGHQTPDDWIEAADGLAQVRTLSGISAVQDLTGERNGMIVRAAPNTNLRFPRTFIPRLNGTVTAGTHWLVTAVFATVDTQQQTMTTLEIPETVARFCRAHGIMILKS
ncbi:DUF2264 domain-containing protein [Gynuella sunshinyii]|uniref:DUF2264 domain-containing protein n=1 Tax=Gynuella sunshinyii YC6258 TaxID=1445510 RepID=A0A0C5VXA6_9GAMM|nr:DUF2264 domain-containing protein [Gynuella sunshinyii]AJQ97968.1 hypothetical protein YC6258_05944 [Gynuella sunshinyii YC6258]